MGVCVILRKWFTGSFHKGLPTGEVRAVAPVPSQSTPTTAHKKTPEAKKDNEEEGTACPDISMAFSTVSSLTPGAEGKCQINFH